MVNNKDITDLWDVVRSLREDIRKLQEADTAMNADFLRRSYESVVERLDTMQKDLDTLKSR
jgi:hypothetical protein